MYSLEDFFEETAKDAVLKKVACLVVLSQNMADSIKRRK